MKPTICAAYIRGSDILLASDGAGIVMELTPDECDLLASQLVSAAADARRFAAYATDFRDDPGHVGEADE